MSQSAHTEGHEDAILAYASETDAAAPALVQQVVSCDGCAEYCHRLAVELIAARAGVSPDRAGDDWKVIPGVVRLDALLAEVFDAEAASRTAPKDLPRSNVLSWPKMIRRTVVFTLAMGAVAAALFLYVQVPLPDVDGELPPEQAAAFAAAALDVGRVGLGLDGGRSLPPHKRGFLVGLALDLAAGGHAAADAVASRALEDSEFASASNPRTEVLARGCNVETEPTALDACSAGVFAYRFKREGFGGRSQGQVALVRSPHAGSYIRWAEMWVADKTVVRHLRELWESRAPISQADLEAWREVLDELSPAIVK